MIKKSIWENKKVWIAFLFLALILTLVFVVEKPRYAPTSEWSVWLINGNIIINQDKYLPIRSNVLVSGTGNLQILNSALIFKGLEGDELSLIVDSFGKLNLDNAVLKSYNLVRFYADTNSQCTIKNSDFINVVIDEGSFVNIVNGLDIYWYVNFDVVDSRGININDAEFSLDDEIIDYSEPYAVFAKTINNVDEYYSLESASHNFVVSKEGYTTNDSYSGEIIDNRGFNYVIGINYVPSFIGNIEDQEWLESEGGLENAFDLNDYFEDLDNDLVYSVSGNSNIQIDIENGLVSFSSPEGWTGSEIVNFMASENNGELYINSNNITIEVLSNSSQNNSQNNIPGDTLGSNFNDDGEDNNSNNNSNEDLHALFDIKVEIEDDTKIVEAGNKVTAKIQLINFGDLRPVDVLLKCNVEDLNNNVLDYSSEYLAIETQVNILRSLTIPLITNGGDYDFVCYLNYEEQEIFGSARFSVISSEENPMEVFKDKSNIFIFVSLFLLLIMFFVFIYFLKKREIVKERK